jgi:Lipocalin-like domain
MTNWILAVALVVMTFSSNGIAQSSDAIVGTWRLVSAKNTTAKGEVKDAFGRNPSGLITYTADGRMTAIITNDGRKPLSVDDYIAAPADERAEAFATLAAYAGRYTVTGDKVIHHVEIAWMQNSVNTDLVRFIMKLDGDRLVLRTPSVVRGGVQLAYQEAIWERVKPKTPAR